MARRYRRRYRRRNNDAVEGIVGILLLGFAFWVWRLWQEHGEVILYSAVVVALVVLAVVITIAIWKYQRNQRKLRALDIAAIDTMDPLEFEVYVGKLLKNRGFTNIRLTEKYDYGVDIIAEKDGVRWGVQVKRYSNLVKAEAIRQVVTALIRYKCDRAVVVTNSTFSRPARELAADNKCVLIDRDVLSEWIVQFQDRDREIT